MVLEQQADTRARPHQGNSPSPQAPNPDGDLALHLPISPLFPIVTRVTRFSPVTYFSPTFVAPANIEC